MSVLVYIESYIVLFESVNNIGYAQVDMVDLTNRQLVSPYPSTTNSSLH